MSYKPIFEDLVLYRVCPKCKETIKKIIKVEYNNSLNDKILSIRKTL